MKIKFFGLVLVIVISVAFSQEKSASETILASDSTKVSQLGQRADSSKVVSDSTSKDTTTVVSAAEKRAKEFPVVKKIENHREQIITSSAIMASIVAIMALMNNYNPR